jgi:hypothetical protein
MLNIFLPEHTLILQTFNEYQVDYLLIGGYAVIIHGYDRSTGDMDIWLRPDNSNKTKIMKAFNALGYDAEGLNELSSYNFEEIVMFFLGIEPYKVDFINKISLVNFDTAYIDKVYYEIDDDLKIPVISLNDLVLSKMNTGRLKDAADIEELQKIKNKRSNK